MTAAVTDLSDVSWPSGSGAPHCYNCPKCHRQNFNPNDVANLYCGFCHVFAEDLRDEPVTLFAHLTPTKLTKRDCFSLAILTLLDSPDIPEGLLVHGLLRDSWKPGQWNQHAWCEFPATAIYADDSEGPITVVCDYSQPDERAYLVPRDLFYAQTGACHMKYFTRSEAVARALKAGNDGPWSDSPGGVP